MTALPPTSICILRLSAIGDCCHVVALVQHIQKHWPETRITWVIGKLEAQLMRAILPQVNFVEFDKKQGYKANFQLKQQLKNQKFDYLLHLQPSIRASIASLFIKARTKIGYHKSRARELQSLFVNQHAPLGEGMHVAENFMDFAVALGLPEAKPSWEISAPEQDLNWAQQQLNQRDTVLICPSASNPVRNWHTQGYVSVINYLHQQGLQTALIGSPAANEIALAASISNACEQAPLNLVGRTNLVQLLAVIQQAKLLIAPDTGPAHMATLVGTPVLGLYAAQTPKRTGPYNSLDKVVSVYEEALLAETGKTLEEVSWRTRVKAEDAMQRIKVEDVIGKLKEMLSEQV